MNATANNAIDMIVGAAVLLSLVIAMMQVVASFAIYAYAKVYRQWQRRHDDPDDEDVVVRK